MRTRITPLVTEAQIRARVQELGAQLTKDYAGKDLVVIGLLNGVFPFFADLVRAMDLVRERPVGALGEDRLREIFPVQDAPWRDRADLREMGAAHDRARPTQADRSRGYRQEVT